MKKWMGLAFLLLVCLLFLTCGKLSRNGTSPANKAPEVFLTNIPPDSSNFSTRAKIYWYGFDQDGYIARYQYLIIPDSGTIIPKAGGYIDSLFVKTIERVSPEDWNDSFFANILGKITNIDTICSGSGWPCHPDSIIRIDTTFEPVPVHAVDSTGTWDNVMLFASVDTARYVSQYFFVRGVDNEGASSRIWKSDSGEVSNFRLFTRNNRPPVTKVTYSYLSNGTGNFIDTMVTEYCLPETTVEWKGLKISWSAEDPDYSTTTQPSFTYSWELLGPFESSTNIIEDSVYYHSENRTTGTPWVDSTSRILVNLENAAGKDYGWYQFRVRARDDAFVPDPSPATATFKIIKPPFLFSENDKNSVLLVDATSYDGRVTLPIRDSIQAFYKRLIKSLVTKGIINSDTLITLDSLYRYDESKVLPPKEEFASHYKLVILFNEGRYSAIQGYPILSNDTGFIMLERYLKVGGRVWMIGQNNFGVSDIPVPTYIRIDPSNRSGGFTQATARVANNYFGVTGYFHPAFSPSSLGGVVTGRTEEMIAAEPYGTHTELPLLEADTTKLNSNYYGGISPTTPPWNQLKGIARASWESVWNANYNERLYTFISYYPDTSKCHGRACASRAYDPYPWVFYENGQPHILRWKTAEFSFPALAIKESQMDSLMVVMVKWFMSDEENP